MIFIYGIPITPETTDAEIAADTKVLKGSKKRLLESVESGNLKLSDGMVMIKI